MLVVAPFRSQTRFRRVPMRRLGWTARPRANVRAQIANVSHLPNCAMAFAPTRPPIACIAEVVVKPALQLRVAPTRSVNVRKGRRCAVTDASTPLPIRDIAVTATSLATRRKYVAAPRASLGAASCPLAHALASIFKVTLQTVARVGSLVAMAERARMARASVAVRHQPSLKWSS